jgi:hypothetical protein
MDTANNKSGTQKPKRRAHLQRVDVKNDDAGGAAARERDVGDDARQRESGRHVALRLHLAGAARTAGERCLFLRGPFSGLLGAAACRPAANSSWPVQVQAQHSAARGHSTAQRVGTAQPLSPLCIWAPGTPPTDHRGSMHALARCRTKRAPRPHGAPACWERSASQGCFACAPQGVCMPALRAKRPRHEAPHAGNAVS